MSRFSISRNDNKPLTQGYLPRGMTGSPTVVSDLTEAEVYHFLEPIPDPYLYSIGERDEDDEPVGRMNGEEWLAARTVTPKTDCQSYLEDPAICDDTGSPKGQCANCGYKETDHLIPPASVPSPYPLLDRISQIQDYLRAQNDLLEWLNDNGYRLCTWDSKYGLSQTRTPFSELVFLANDFDPKAVEAERRALLKEAQTLANPQPT